LWLNFDDPRRLVALMVDPIRRNGIFCAGELLALADRRHWWIVDTTNKKAPLVLK